MNFFDKLEIRSKDQRDGDLFDLLPKQLRNASENTSSYGAILKDYDLDEITSVKSLSNLQLLGNLH